MQLANRHRAAVDRSTGDDLRQLIAERVGTAYPDYECAFGPLEYLRRPLDVTGELVEKRRLDFVLGDLYVGLRQARCAVCAREGDREQAAETWRLSAGLSALRERLTLRPGSTDTADVIAQQGRDPTHTWMLRSSFDLPYRTEFDAIVRRVSALSAPAVPGYTAVDLRAGWRARRDLELSLTGENLFSGGHGEFADRATRTRFGQGVFFKVACRV